MGGCVQTHAMAHKRVSAKGNLVNLLSKNTPHPTPPNKLLITDLGVKKLKRKTIKQTLREKPSSPSCWLSFSPTPLLPLPHLQSPCCHHTLCSVLQVPLVSPSGDPAPAWVTHGCSPAEVPTLPQSASGSRWIDQAPTHYLGHPSQMSVEALLAQQALGKRGLGGHGEPQSILPLFLSLRILSPAGVFSVEASAAAEHLAPVCCVSFPTHPTQLCPKDGSAASTGWCGSWRAEHQGRVYR